MVKDSELQAEVLDEDNVNIVDTKKKKKETDRKKKKVGHGEPLDDIVFEDSVARDAHELAKDLKGSESRPFFGKSVIPSPLLHLTSSSKSILTGEQVNGDTYRRNGI